MHAIGVAVRVLVVVVAVALLLWAFSRPPAEVRDAIITPFTNPVAPVADPERVPPGARPEALPPAPEKQAPEPVEH
jgi:hypothetical protein